MITKPTKYTREVVRAELQSILQEILGDDEIIYIGQPFIKKPYPKQYYSKWAKQFENSRGISDTIKRIDDILETRAVVGAMKGKLNPATTIFHLKNNYKWTDQQQININASSNTPELTDSQKLKLIERTRKSLATKVLQLTPSTVAKEVTLEP